MSTEPAKRIGEVIEASTTGFVAQCYELFGLPSLGSLVKTTDQAFEMYGIVYNATTASIESGRRPIARGDNAASTEDIYRSNPQLLKLLRSEFDVLVVGYRLENRIYQYLPPKPARIHGFVYCCSPEESKEFGGSFAFLNRLISINIPVPVDELIAACLRQMAQNAENPHAYMVAAGKILTVLLKGDLNRLRAVLEKIAL